MATLVSAEVHFAQRLAANEKRTRDKAVKRLRKWLELKSVSTKGGLSDDDFLKIWKGLHYCMWMSDKPLVQEELASSISGLIHCFQVNTSAVFSFIRVFFQTEAREWSGIDRWRVDKFMMLIRRFLNQSLVYLKNGGWAENLLLQFTDIVTMEIVDVDGERRVPEGLKYHIVDIYLEELSTVGAAQLTEEQVLVFLKPFYSVLPLMKSKTVVRYVINHVFDKVIEEEVNRLQREVNEDEDEVEDVEEMEGAFPRLKVNLKDLADKIFEGARAKSCLSRNRPVLYKLVNRLQNVSKGALPTEDVPGSDDEDPIQYNDINSAVRRLEKLDNHLIEQSGISEWKKKKREKLKQMIAEQEKLERKQKRKKTESEVYVVDQSQSESNYGPIESEADLQADLHLSPFSETKLDKKKKKKKKTLTSESEHELEGNLNVLEESKEMEYSPVKIKKSKKKKKRKSDESINTITKNGDESVKAKKKRKSTDNITTSKDTNSQNMLEEEIEIWIPNKKYKGKLNVQEETLNKINSPIVKQSRKSKVKEAPSSFAQFEMGLKTPPAFVKKAFTKLRTPKTEPFKKVTKMTSPERGSMSAVKKRVSFNMKKNTSLDFDDSLHFSPELPFHPEIRPDQSILKSPVCQLNLSKKVTKLKTKGKRLKAADFF